LFDSFFFLQDCKGATISSSVAAFGNCKTESSIPVFK
jgi:hypothetical protein